MKDIVQEFIDRRAGQPEQQPVEGDLVSQFIREREQRRRDSLPGVQQLNTNEQEKP